MSSFQSLRDTLKPFDTLKPLNSDLALDKKNESLEEYLKFYHLTFSQEICSAYRIGTFSSANYILVAQYFAPALESNITLIIVLIIGIL